MALKKITLIILSSFLIVSLSVAIIGSATQVLLYPDTYEKALDQSDVYDYVELQLKEQGYIDDTIFVENSIKPIIMRVVRRTLTYVRGDEATLDITINLNDTVREFLAQRVGQLSECGPEELPTEEKMCLPEGISGEEFLEMQLAGLDDEQLQVNLGEALNKEGTLDSAREAVGFFRSIIIASYILSLILIGFIVLLNRESVVSMTKWIDYDLFSVSVGVFLSSFLIRWKLAEFIPESLSMLEGFLTTLIFTVLEIMNYYAAALLAVAVFLLVFALITKK